MQLNSTEMLVGPRRAQLGVSGKHLLPAHVCHPPLLCVLLQLLLRFNLYRVTSTTTGDLITLLLPHPVTTGSRFAICSVTGSSASLTPGLCSHAGRARQDASAGQGRTVTGLQQHQTSLPFLRDKDHPTASVKSLTAQEPASHHGTTWQLQEKSQSKRLKFTFQESASGPGSSPGTS